MGRLVRRSIGLLGGTFDPPHLAHLVVADQVLDRLGLDEVRFLVAKDPWQKTGKTPVTPAEQRLAMVREAVEGRTGLSACDIELSIEGPTYTTVTLDALARAEPDVDWFLILGSDAAAGLDSWHQPQALSSQATFVVVNRSGVSSDVPPGFKVKRVKIPGLEVSSTALRERICLGQSVRFLVPDGVIDLYERLSIYSRSQ